MDLRNTGEGGWFYAEHELFSVFVPLIGPDGGMVYMTMCRLIPLAAVDPDRPVTVRSVSAESGVSKSTVHRRMAQIVALGMVEETRHSHGRPSTYRLVSLRKLSLVGMEALRNRLGVPVGDTGNGKGHGVHILDRVAAAAETGSASVDAVVGVGEEVFSQVDAATGRVQNGVPGGDTVAVESKTGASAGSVSQKTASVSQKRASVSHLVGHPLIKEKEEEDSPLPPSQAKGVSDSLSETTFASPDDELRYINQLRARMKPPLPPLAELPETHTHTGALSPPSRRRRRAGP